MALLQPYIMSNPLPRPAAQAAQSPTFSEPQSIFFSRRSARQLGLFFAGASFFAVSTMVTRRALVRRYKAAIPKFYQQSNRPNEVNGAMEAMEALNLATINVFSASMMVGGGLLYAFDISSVDDMRRTVRSRIGMAGNRRSGSNTDQEYEKEIEEWFTSTFGKKEFKKLSEKIQDKEGKEVKEDK